MTRMLLGIIAGVALASSNLACQSFSSMDVTSAWSDKAPVCRPTEVGAIWQDGVDVQLDANHGGQPIAGFAGRIFFTQARDGQSGQTVLVNNPVKVMLFDDRPQQQPGPPQPLETWTILPEHLQLLIKKDLTGWGYSIWLPWNTYHPSIQNVRLTVEYTDSDGNRLLSEPAPIQVRDANKGGMPKLKVETFKKNTWEK